MKRMNFSNTNALVLAAILAANLANGDEKPASANSVNGVKGVKQEAVESVKKVEPPTIDPAAATTPQGVNRVEGIKAVAPNAVQPVPPPPAGFVSTIQAVKGVQGIIAPKQLNLEAALLIKEGGEGTPAGTGKGASAAAALLSGPPGLTPGPPIPNGDGRAAFQEFEKLTAPGS